MEVERQELIKEAQSQARKFCLNCTNFKRFCAALVEVAQENEIPQERIMTVAHACGAQCLRPVPMPPPSTETGVTCGTSTGRECQLDELTPHMGNLRPKVEEMLEHSATSV